MPVIAKKTIYIPHGMLTEASDLVMLNLKVNNNFLMKLGKLDSKMFMRETSPHRTYLRLKLVIEKHR